MLLTFLSRYLCTIGHLECLALGRGRPGFTQNFTGSALLGKSFARPGDFIYRTFTFYGSPFQRDSTITRYGNSPPGLAPRPKAPATPTAHRRKAVACSWFRLFPFRSPLLRESLRFLLLRLLRCFSSAAYLYPAYFVQPGVARFGRAGLPHSDISGSKPACGSPKLFVACYVLHRLQVPRHPPCALSNLTTQSPYSKVETNLSFALLKNTHFKCKMKNEKCKNNFAF